MTGLTSRAMPLARDYEHDLLPLPSPLPRNPPFDRERITRKIYFSTHRREEPFRESMTRLYRTLRGGY